MYNNGIRRRGASPARICEQCGSAFYKSPAQASAYCTKACWIAAGRPRPILSAHDRFWPKISLGDACWTWTGNADKDGYGKLRTVEQRDVRAHVYGWWLATGEWPPAGLIVGHTCDTPACVRNDDAGIYTVDGIEYRRMGHLWLGTVAANNRDKAGKGRAPSGDLSSPRRYRERMPRGEMHPHAVLTDDLVRAIRIAHAAGENLRAFARAHGLTHATVYNVARRGLWAHVT